MVDEEGPKDLVPLGASGVKASEVQAAGGSEPSPRVSPVPPPRSDRPSGGRTLGPLLPMRIIGVNAGPAQASPGSEQAAPISGRPPASIPPPKPASGRPSKEPPAEPTEEAARDSQVPEDVTLTPPWPPVEDVVEVEEAAPLSDAKTDPLQDRVTPEPAIPVGPPPLPVERRSNPSSSAREPAAEYALPPPLPDAPPLPSMPAPPVAPLRSPRSDSTEARLSEPPPNPRAGFDAPTPPETPAVRAEVLAARAALEAKGDRSKPPALPTRKRTSMEMEGAQPTTVSAEVPSQPPLPSDGTTKPKKRRPPPIPPPRSTFTGGSTEEEAAKRRHWWEEVFGDDFLRAIIEPTESQLAREVDFIETSFNLEKPAAILDLACGSGRHAVELTKRGYTTVGYDLSVTQLARASETAQQQGAKVAFLHGDMREMGFEQMFDAVLCWNASFGYFEEEKNLGVLRNIHRALKPGGCLLLDIPNRDFVVAQQPAQNWFEGDGCVCMDDMHVDFITSRLCVKRTIMLDDGRNKESLYSIRLFGLHELGRMLHEIGFRVNEVTGHVATRGVFMGATSPRLITLVTKR